MADDRTVREAMAEMGITVSEVASRCGLDASYVSRQLRGESPLGQGVRQAFLDVIEERAIATLSHTARLLRDHGETEAADACDRLGERLGSASARTGTGATAG